MRTTKKRSLQNLSPELLNQVELAVSEYIRNKPAVERMAKSIYGMLGDFDQLRPFVHSLKYRVKDPEHLRAKLIRKATADAAASKQFVISKDNLFKKITDLAGVRILHLHTRQAEQIDIALRALFKEQDLKLVEGPTANTWDPEYSEFFRNLKMKTKTEGKFYTSIHYIIGANDAAKTRCEIQVRTLMEEVWGEVSHTIDYPSPSQSVACREQLKVLARVTSSGTRLVDSIFRSDEEYSRLTSVQKTDDSK